MKPMLSLVCCALLLLIAGCDSGPKSGRGFTLPEGDPNMGEATFTQLQCNSCHIVVGKPEIPHPENAEISVKLGGKVRTVQTYGQLVTSIINPSHRLAKGYPLEMIQEQGESKMINYNVVMSVEQLTDLVAFLQAQYELEPYVPTRYQGYFP